MNRVQAMEAKYYLGSVSHSLEHLPKWYQLFAASGILFIIRLRDNPIVSWLVMHLHSSFGTGFIWYDEYQQLLEQMSFNERLCFTLYGVALGTAVVLLYKIFCRGRYGLGWSAMQLFPDRKGASAAMLVVLSLCEMVRMRGLIASCLGEEGSLANIAIKGFAGLGEAGYDPRLTSSNQHFIVQVELLKALLKHVIFFRLPIVAVSVVFRLFRDIPRKAHAALRWHLATVSVVNVVREALVMYVNQSYNDLSRWASFAWAIVFIGTVNFLYGPSKRAGMVVTATTAHSLSEAVRASVTCTALWCIASLLVLTVVVSVHVVELISLWLITSLLLLWTPAIVDSCSINYITMLTGAFSWLAKSMGYLTTRGSVRFGLLLGSWWLAACLVYNVTTNLARNRYAGMIVVSWFFFWAVSPTHESAARTVVESVTQATAATLQAAGQQLQPLSTHGEGVLSTEATADTGKDRSSSLLFTASARATTETLPEEGLDMTSFIGGRLSWLCQVADYDAGARAATAAATTSHQSRFLSLGLRATSRPTPPTNQAADHAAAGRDLFTQTLQTAILLCAAATVFNHFFSYRLYGDTKLKLRRQSIMLATPAVLCRKAIRAAVLVFCVANFLLSAVAFHVLVLPHVIMFLPDFVSHTMSLGIGCVVLGALMDTKESMYDAVARVLGLNDPPALGEDGSPLGSSGGGNRDALGTDEDLDDDIDFANEQAHRHM